MMNFIFDTQNRELEHLLAKTPEERNGITWALRLNHQAFGFAEEGREFDAYGQFRFVEAIIMAIRNGRYEADFGVFWGR